MHGKWCLRLVACGMEHGHAEVHGARARAGRRARGRGAAGGAHNEATEESNSKLQGQGGKGKFRPFRTASRYTL